MPNQFEQQLRKLTKNALIDTLVRLANREPTLMRALQRELPTLNSEPVSIEIPHIDWEPLWQTADELYDWLDKGDFYAGVHELKQITQTLMHTASSIAPIIWPDVLKLSLLGFIFDEYFAYDDESAALLDPISALVAQTQERILNTGDTAIARAQQQVISFLDNNQDRINWPTPLQLLTTNIPLFLPNDANRLSEAATDYCRQQSEHTYSNPVGEFTRFQVTLITAKDGISAAKAYCEEHFDLPEVQVECLQLVLQDEDITLMERLLPRARGIQWGKALAAIYAKRKRHLDVARVLTETFFVHGDATDYRALKAAWEQVGQWTKQRAAILKQVPRVCFDEDALAIYTLENQPQNALHVLLKMCTITANTLVTYGAFVYPANPEKIRQLFKDQIDTELHTADRAHYRNIASLIEAFRKNGEVEQAEVWRQQLKDAYPKRRALREELNRI